MVDPQNVTDVKQVPEPLSPRYRNRVLKVSSRYRSHSVKYEPDSHICARDTFDHKRDSAELNRRLIDEKIASDQDFFVGLDGIEPSASALSGLRGPSR
jgi:hypothetical protein